MINVIMYSFDRACQLDLALRSIKDHFAEWQSCTWTIIVKCSNDEYSKGYSRVRQLHPERQFEFVHEINFRDDTRRAFNKPNKPYTTWMMDDDAFIRPFSLQDQQFKDFANNQEITTLSCRLAPYMNECYTQSRKALVPDLTENLTWNWRNSSKLDLFHGYPTDWGYPMSIASFHIFRTYQIASTVNKVIFKAPNSLEGQLALNPPAGDYMMCYPRALNINIPINKAQTENGNRFGNKSHLQQDVLNREFIVGKRLSTDKVYGAVTPSPHYELDLEFE